MRVSKPKDRDPSDGIDFTSTAYELGDERVGSKLLERRRVGSLRPVPLDVHEAQESERRAHGSAKLVPGAGSDSDDVERGELDDAVADEGSSRASQHDHNMDMLVTLECRVTALRNFEIAELAG
jgi:hypothetical protein